MRRDSPQRKERGRLIEALPAALGTVAKIVSFAVGAIGAAIMLALIIFRFRFGG